MPKKHKGQNKNVHPKSASLLGSLTVTCPGESASSLYLKLPAQPSSLTWSSLNPLKLLPHIATSHSQTGYLMSWPVSTGCHGVQCTMQATTNTLNPTHLDPRPFDPTFQTPHRPDSMIKLPRRYLTATT